MPKTTLSFYLHIIAVAVIVFALGHFFYGRDHGAAGGAVAAKEGVYDRVMRTGTIRCGYVLYPAYVRKDPNSGALSGLHYDVVNEMGKRLGLKVEWAEEAGWGNFIQGLQAGRYDMICSGGWQAANEAKLIAYAPAIYYSALGVWVRADDTRFDANPDILNDPAYRFVATDGSLTGSLLAVTYPRAQVTSLPNLTDFATMYENVTSGKVDAVLAENYSIGEYLKNNPGKLKNILAAKPVRVFPVSPVIYPNTDLALQHMVNGAITELNNSGFIDKILAQYGLDERLILKSQKPYQLPTQ